MKERKVINTLPRWLTVKLHTTIKSMIPVCVTHLTITVFCYTQHTSKQHLQSLLISNLLGDEMGNIKKEHLIIIRCRGKKVNGKTC